MLASLPHVLTLRILSALPVDARLRCLEVCHAWRALLRSDPALWARLDLADATGGLARPASDALCRAALARAGGALQALSVSDGAHIALETLFLAGGTHLRELRVRHDASPCLGLFGVDRLLADSPHLRLLHADVACHSLRCAQHMLRNDGSYAPLRVRRLSLDMRAERITAADVLALAADAATHGALEQLALESAPLRAGAALEAVVSLAAAKGFSAVELLRCGLSGAAAPALARLLRSAALTRLSLTLDRPDAPGEAGLFEAAGSALLLAAALRGNGTLTSLRLWNDREGDAGVWADAGAAAALLGALTGHASLRTLHLGASRAGSFAHQAAAGALLGALVAADAPALEALSVPWCGLGDAGLGPLFDALRQNTHLRHLDCQHNAMSEPFARGRLLPAAAAAVHLRTLAVGTAHTAQREAQALVERRAAS
jgi:hypothetical protein